MFTTITLSPNSVAAFACFKASSDYAIELVTDLQAAIDEVCNDRRIDKLGDDTDVNFTFRSDDRLWEGSIWLTIYDDLPGCPIEVNCSIEHYNEATADYRYETFEVTTVEGYSRSEVYEIKRNWQHREVAAYCKGYESGQESMVRNYSL